MAFSGRSLSVVNPGEINDEINDEEVPGQGPAGPPGQGVPPGGFAGQLLSKVDSTDYNTAWIDFDGGNNLIDLDASRIKRSVVPVDRVVMYVGEGTPTQWPAISGAVTGALFTSSTGEGLFSKDADWDLVGAGDVPEGLATEEYADDAAEDALKAAKAYTDEKIAEGIEGDISLDGYATSLEVSEGDAKTLESANTYTDEAVGKIVIPEIPPLPDELVYEDDLEDFATKEYVDDAVGAIDIPEIPEVGDALTTEQVQELIDASKPNTYAELEGKVVGVL